VQAAPGEVPARRVSDFWLGLECYPADAALRTQLGLEKQGLVVEQVVPDSPGDQGGIKPHDVLLKAGERSLVSVSDLVEAIDKAKATELSIDVLRGGKPITVKVTPEQRPEDQDMARRVPERELGELRRWIESLRPGERPDGPLRYRVFGPGAVLPPSASQKLPKDVTISVTRTGEEPATIVVKKGDQQWEVSEKDLKDLPEDLRPYVERMLGRNGAFLPPRPDFFEPGLPPGAPSERPRDGHLDGQRNDGRMDRQMNELHEQMQRLREQFEELRRSLPKQEKAAEGQRA
jgi:hypothetical protein